MGDYVAGNGEHLASALTEGGDCLKPLARVVCDGHHNGTLFVWRGDEWIVVDLEGGTLERPCDRLAVVTLDADAERTPDDGLNQRCLGCDLDVPTGEWVVAAESLDGLREDYGEELIVLWEQGGEAG